MLISCIVLIAYATIGWEYSKTGEIRYPVTEYFKISVADGFFVYN